MWTVGGTIKTVLDKNRGVGPGFDALRFGLAAIIFMGTNGPSGIVTIRRKIGS